MSTGLEPVSEGNTGDKDPSVVHVRRTLKNKAPLCCYPTRAWPSSNWRTQGRSINAVEVPIWCIEKVIGKKELVSGADQGDVLGKSAKKVYPLPA